jgi:hypothetical protein
VSESCWRADLAYRDGAHRQRRQRSGWGSAVLVSPTPRKVGGRVSIHAVPTYLGITLNARLRPLDRGAIYEDPLQEVLDVRSPGSEITGGGTLMKPGGEPASSDVDIDLEGDPEAGLALVIETLLTLGAPKGSTARLEGSEPITFGTADGVGVYLNGADLPESVYATSDVNDLITQLNERLGAVGRMYSWQGPRETALYFYGSSADQMRALMRDVLDTYPLARQCRLVTLTDEAESDS